MLASSEAFLYERTRDSGAKVFVCKLVSTLVFGIGVEWCACLTVSHPINLRELFFRIGVEGKGRGRERWESVSELRGALSFGYEI